MSDEMPIPIRHSDSASGKTDSDGTGSRDPPADGPTRQTKASLLKAKFPSACTECRRRKQKCDLGNPCTSCSRRFPQPICEYSTGRAKGKKQTSASTQASQTETDIRGLYSHLDFERVGDVIAELEESLAQDNGVVEDIQRFASILPLPSKRTPVSYSRSLPPRPNLDEEYWRSYTKDFTPPETWAVYEQLCRLGPRGKRDRLETGSGRSFMNFLLKYRAHTMDHVVQETVNHERGSMVANGEDMIWALEQSSPPCTEIGGLDHELRHLPMAPTKINKELLRTHLQILTRFKASIDGYPRHDNSYLRLWVSHGLQDPLMMQTDIFTSACFLHETGHLPKSIMLTCQNVLHKTLNEYLASPKTQLSDSAILGVYQLVTSTWLWGETEDLRVHMRGLKTMLVLRGGLQNLGMEGITSKSILVQDAVIALAHEIEPCLLDLPGFEYDDPFRVPFQVSFNSPFAFECPPFIIPTSTLKLHPNTAQMLDGVRSLFQLVLSLPGYPTSEQLLNVATAATQTINTINNLSEELPQSDSALDGDVETMAPIYTNFHVETEQTKESRKMSTAYDAHSSPDAAARSQLQQDKDAKDAKATAHIYKSVRETALIYCHAILQRKSTSQVLRGDGFTTLWWMTWAVSLEKWKSAAGIFVWMLMVLAPSGHDTVLSRFSKSFLNMSLMAMAMENWHVTFDTVMVALKLQRWLRGGDARDEDDKVDAQVGADGTKAFAGGKSIERYGYALKHGDRYQMDQVLK